MLKTCFSCFVFLGRGHGFWPILMIIILVFVNLDCFLVCLFFVFLSSSSLRKSVCCFVNYSQHVYSIFYLSFVECFSCLDFMFWITIFVCHFWFYGCN